MNIEFYTFVIVLSFIAAEGRLIHKNKTKTLEASQTENPNPTIRLTRDVKDESLTGFSKEETVSDEFLQSYNRRHRMFLESNPKFVRIVRDSKENTHKNQQKNDINDHKIENEHSTILVKKPVPKFGNYFENTVQPLQQKINNISDHKIGNDHLTVLVKKPIPRFTDIDSEDDFQTKMTKARAVFSDSGDHEDEDFNVDDYDFDVNHDEFLSGRKPLEPRMNLKNIESIIAAQPQFKIQAKIVDPKQHRAIKREGAATQYSRESDYYDDVTTTTDQNKESQESENEYSDESSDSKEEKKAPVRSVRSWDVGTYINKFSDKTSKVMSKFLSVLPMFPQVPNDKNVNKGY